MHADNPTAARRKTLGALLALIATLSPTANGETLEWGATKFFRYNIENVIATPKAASPGAYDVKIVFSVTNPITNQAWDIKGSEPFTSSGAGMTADFGWDPSSDLTNTGSESGKLDPVKTVALGKGAAIPVQVRSLQTASSRCTDTTTECPGAVSLENRFFITRTVVPLTFVTPAVRGRVAIEGKPVCNGVPTYDCMPPPTGSSFVPIPVRSAVANFSFIPAGSATSLIQDPRRPVVDIAKCQQCHDGGQHGDTVVPRLSLHGANRNENLALCVVCHNPNQTDFLYRYATAGTSDDPRISGAETPIDFKVMVHSIHAGGFREKPYVVVGFNSSVVDFSHVRFPRELRDCSSCHVEVDGRGTFELPLAKSVLGTTVKTQSTYLVARGTERTINVNPADDAKISPTAAVCSSCHDKAEVRKHMVETGRASFSTRQEYIGSTVVERCANCHGPGKDRDVRRVHGVGGIED